MKVTAQVQRSGDWWAIEVPEVPGVFTQAKRLEQVPETVADAVATMLDDVEAESVEVQVVPILDVEVAAAVSDATRLAGEAQTAQVAASAAMRMAAHLLRENASLSVRDVAAVLGVSHQRISQLVDSFDPSKERFASPMEGSARGKTVEVAPTADGTWQVRLRGGPVGGLFASKAAATAAGRELAALVVKGETGKRRSDDASARR